MAKLSPFGVFDDAFGLNGIQITQFNDFIPDILYTGADAIGMQADGKIVVTGTAKRNKTLIRYLENGALDPEFGQDGIVQTPFYTPGSIDKAYAVAMQQDGKLVLAGSTFSNKYSSNGEFALVRFLDNGFPDLSFGNNGRVVTSWGTFSDGAKAIAIQPDGMILVAGYSATGYYEYTSFALARFFPDGRLDEQFGTFGLVNNDFGGSSETTRANAILLQPDGKILLAGKAANRMALARYLSDGTLDQTFGNGGNAQFPTLPFESEAYAVKLQPDGKIVVVGSRSDLIIMRLNPDGSLDADFGNGGVVIKDFGYNEKGYGLAIQPDGKIIVTGNIESTIEVFIARYLPDGTPDIDFNGSGFLVTDFGQDSKAYAIDIQGDGKILVGGAGKYDIALARFLSNGLPDPDFGNYGLAYTGLGNGGSGFHTAYALLIEPDHDIVLAGSSGSSWQPQNEFIIARFKAGTVNSTVQQAAFIKNASLYPNPVADASMLSFNLPEATELWVRIYHSSGQLISNPIAGLTFQTGEHKIKLPTSTLIPGQYFVSITGHNSEIALPLVKVR